MSNWPEDERLWQSVGDALAEVISPALPRGHAAATALQLQGLVRYALERGDDPTALRTAELAALVDLGVGATWATVAACASQRLVDARRSRRADEGADRIRQALLRHLHVDLEVAAPLLETFARHGEPTAGEVESEAPESAALQSWMAGHVGKALESFSARVMSGGHSRRMLDVRAVTSKRSWSLVVRVEQGGVFGTDGATEAMIMQALQGVGVAVAPILWVEPSSEPLGHPFFVMSRVPGSDDPEDGALQAFVEALDGLHRVPVESIASAFDVRPADPEAGVQAAIDHWEVVYRRASSTRIPLLEDGAAWLRQHLHPTAPVAIVHGDPGPGNFLHSGGRITAITDWELAHLGDPAEDWTYLAAVRGVRLMGQEQWASLLTDLVGVEYGPETWRAWTAFNAFKGACANITALRVFNEGPVSRPNLLAVGTAIQLRFTARLAQLIGG